MGDSVEIGKCIDKNDKIENCICLSLEYYRRMEDNINKLKERINKLENMSVGRTVHVYVDKKNDDDKWIYQ